MTIDYVNAFAARPMFRGYQSVCACLRPSSVQRKKKKQEQNKLYVGVTGLGGVQARRVVMHYATLCHKQKKRVWPSATARLMHSEVRKLTYTGDYLSKTRSFRCHHFRASTFNTNARCLEHFCPIIAHMSQPRQTHGTAVARAIRGAHSKRGMRLDALTTTYGRDHI
jgi:hypothetical protein